MTVKYLLIFPQGKAVAGYDDQGNLCFWEVAEPFNDKTIDALYRKGHLPVTEELCRSMTQRSMGKIQVSKMLEDVSFDTFWSNYDYKVGKKDRAKKLWDALGHVERVAVLRSIPKYKRWLSGRSIDTVYPETYLSQKRWENEFK